MKASIPYEEVLDEMLRDDELAAMYLGEVLADNDPDMLKMAVGDIARAKAGGTGVKPLQAWFRV